MTILCRGVIIAMNSGFDKTYDVCIVMAWYRVFLLPFESHVRWKYVRYVPDGTDALENGFSDKLPWPSSLKRSSKRAVRWGVRSSELGLPFCVLFA